MKLVIPGIAKVGAHDFKVVWSAKILDLLEAKGGSEYRNNHFLRLMPGRPVSQQFQTLMHEGIHQVDHVFDVGELSENQVNTLAAGMTQFLMSLGIEPDFSEIQDEE